jgi:hypothetical protein
MGNSIPLTPETPLVVRRLADDGRHSSRIPRLPICYADVEPGSFQRVDSYPPGAGPRRLACRVRPRTRLQRNSGGDAHVVPVREWVPPEGELVVIDEVATSGTVLAALGHLTEGHACPDCLTTP